MLNFYLLICLFHPYILYFHPKPIEYTILLNNLVFSLLLSVHYNLLYYYQLVMLSFLDCLALFSSYCLLLYINTFIYKHLNV